jgi:hypothetical protein
VTIYGINVSKLMKRYYAGEFYERPDFITNVQVYTDGKRVLADIKASSITQSNRHIHTNINGETTKTVTSNCSAFAGEFGGYCMYCRRTFETEVLGYVVDIDFQNDIEMFYMDDVLCGPRCVLSYLDYINLSTKDRELYSYNTKRMFDIWFPGVEITKMPDFRTLKCNAGTEEEKDWLQNGYQLIEGHYIRPAGAVNVKREFIVTETRKVRATR